MKITLALLLFAFSNTLFAQGNVGRTQSFFSHLLNLGQPPQIGQCNQQRRSRPLDYSSPRDFQSVKLECQSQRTASYQGLTLSVLTQEQAQNLFNELQQLSYLPMKYLEDGCYARSHEIALIAQQNGLQMGKAFLIAPEGDDLLYPREGVARFSNNFAGWSYHATAFLIVEQPDGSLVPTVFDLGVASGPQTFEQWRSHLHSRPSATSIVTRSREMIFDSGNFSSPGVSIIDRLRETENLIDELGWSEYIFRREQGWL
jgi:hypothetical protein